MMLETKAIICGLRLHGEHGAIVRALTPDHGLRAGYVRGSRSRTMRPVLIPANVVLARYVARTGDQLPSLALELDESRGPLLAEPLAAAGLDWTTTLAASILPEAHPYPRLFEALDGVLRAIEAAPSARRWASALVQYERLLLAELGFGTDDPLAAPVADWKTLLEALHSSGKRLERDLFSGRRIDVMAGRERLIERLKRAAA